MGAKRAFELFPGPLKRRMTKERRKHWDRQQQATLARVLNESSEADKAVRAISLCFAQAPMRPLPSSGGTRQQQAACAAGWAVL